MKEVKTRMNKRIEWQDLDRLRRQWAFYSEPWHAVGTTVVAENPDSDLVKDAIEIAEFKHAHHAQLVAEIHNAFGELSNALLMLGRNLADLKGKK